MIGEYTEFWKAVVHQAYKDLSNTKESIRKEAQEWFLEENGDFIEVVRMAELNEHVIRRKAKEKINETK